MQHPEKKPCQFLSVQAQQLIDVIPLMPKNPTPGKLSPEVAELFQRAHDDFLMHASACQDCADVISIAGILQVSA